MERAVLASLVSRGCITREMARSLGSSPTNIRYWVRKYGLQLKQNQFGPNYIPPRAPYKCGNCGETDPSKFYGRKRTVCGPCHNVYTLKAGQNKRTRAIEYFGGRCQACGFNKYSCSLDFHHKNRSTKSPKYSSMRGWSWERILEELKNCILLCKNCHAATHAGLLEIDQLNVGA
jgi:hypothetical protein